MDNILNFVSKLVDSLVWPFVTVLFLFIFKEPIKRIILLIERFKVKDVEFFLRNTEKVVESIQDEVNGVVEIDQQKLDKAPKDAVISAWIKLEKVAEKKYLDLFSTDNKKTLGPDRALGYFEYMGTLVPKVRTALSKLRELHYQVVHESDIVVTEDGAKAFVAAINTIIKQIESIVSVTKIKLNHLTHLMFEINAVLDTGKYDHITIKDICREIENGTVLRYLAKEAKPDIDLSPFLYADDNELNFEKNYIEQLQSICGGSNSGYMSKKWGITNNGLCLLIAWTAEIIQRGSGWQANNEYL